MKTIRLLTLFSLLAVLVAACRPNISRNGDGSLTVETTLTQQQLQDAITASISDPLIKELTVSLQSGYVLVTGQRQRLNDPSKTDNMSFRLDLGVSNGELTAAISEAEIDGVALEQNRVDHLNETIANRLSKLGQKNSKGSLQAVSVTPEAVTLTWIVSK